MHAKYLIFNYTTNGHKIKYIGKPLPNGSVAKFCLTFHIKSIILINLYNLFKIYFFRSDLKEILK